MASIALAPLAYYKLLDRIERENKVRLGMATGGFGTGHPYPIPVPKRFSYFPTRPKPGTGRGGAFPSPDRVKIMFPIPGPSRPGYVLSGRGGAGRGCACLGWAGLNLGKKALLMLLS